MSFVGILISPVQQRLHVVDNQTNTLTIIELMYNKMRPQFGGTILTPKWLPHNRPRKQIHFETRFADHFLAPHLIFI